MNEKTSIRQNTRGIIGMILVLSLGFCIIYTDVRPANAATSKTKKIYDSVCEAYGTSFPLSKNNMIKTPRKNVFGNYSTVLGVSMKYISSYTAAQKSNSKEEYICMVCKATSKKSVKKIKTKIKKYIKNEYKSNLSYHSELGKKLLKKSVVGSRGKYVYLFVLDTSGNKKAITAFKESLK